MPQQWSHLDPSLCSPPGSCVWGCGQENPPPQALIYPSMNGEQGSQSCRVQDASAEGLRESGEGRESSVPTSTLACSCFEDMRGVRNMVDGSIIVSP